MGAATAYLPHVCELAGARLQPEEDCVRPPALVRGKDRDPRHRAPLRWTAVRHHSGACDCRNSLFDRTSEFGLVCVRAFRGGRQSPLLIRPKFRSGRGRSVARVRPLDVRPRAERRRTMGDGPSGGGAGARPIRTLVDRRGQWPSARMGGQSFAKHTQTARRKPALGQRLDSDGEERRIRPARGFRRHSLQRHQRGGRPRGGRFWGCVQSGSSSVRPCSRYPYSTGRGGPEVGLATRARTEAERPWCEAGLEGNFLRLAAQLKRSGRSRAGACARGRRSPRAGAVSNTTSAAGCPVAAGPNRDTIRVRLDLP